MEGVTVAYGIALPESQPARPAPGSSTPGAAAAAGAGGFGAADLIAFANRWETAAVGAALVIGAALYVNALYDAA